MFRHVVIITGNKTIIIKYKTNNKRRYFSSCKWQQWRTGWLHYITINSALTISWMWQYTFGRVSASISQTGSACSEKLGALSHLIKLGEGNERLDRWDLLAWIWDSFQNLYEEVSPIHPVSPWKISVLYVIKNIKMNFF